MASDGRTDAITLDEMGEAEIGQLTALMAQAFDADAPDRPGFDQHLLDCYHCSDFFVRFPPGCYDAEQYTVHVAGEPGGGAVIWHFTPFDAVLGLFFVAPGFQHHGVGRRVWDLIEARYPDVRHWTVAAPSWSPRTLYFYQRQCGFYASGRAGAYVTLAKDLEP